jgi:hypothetical protein
MPELHREVPGPAVLPLRNRPRARHTRRARPAIVPFLPVHRSGQPGGLHQVRPAPPGLGPHARRVDLPGLPPAPGHDVLGLRAPGAMRDLYGYRPAAVPALPAALGGMLSLREDQAGPGRHPEPVALPGLHAARRLVLARLPRLRRGSTDPARTALPALRAATAAGRTSRQRIRGNPAGTAGVPRQPGWHRPPGNRAPLAGQ